MINIDHPTPETEAPAQDRIPSPETAYSPHAPANFPSVSVRASPLVNNGEEWSSPAFIKRARTSYGSLFDNESDIFAGEDGTIQGKGRKRTRLSRTWRYESRSPSPDAEQEYTLETSLEPEHQSKPAMADEGCQTTGLEEGDAAEVLAGFHKHTHNVGSESYSAPNGARISEAAEPQVLLDNHHEPRGQDLSFIQTQLNSEDNNVSSPFAQFATPARKVPSSPRLQPVSSDALPLVSPLITNSFGTFLGMGPRDGFPDQSSNLTIKQASALSELPVQRVGDNAPEDLYGASPTHSQAAFNELNGSQNGSVAMDFGKTSNFQNHLPSEDQYGHWQSSMAQESHGGSPRQIDDQMIEDEQQNGILGPNREDDLDFETSEVPNLVPDNHHQQYPDPEDDIYGQQISDSWGRGFKRTPYPDFPKVEGEPSNAHLSHQTLHPSIVAMSRSGSAQSDPVDLTESGNREGDDIPVEGLIYEEDSERSDITDDQNERVPDHSDDYRNFREESSEDGEEHSVDDEPSMHRLQDGRRVHDENVSQYSEEEERYVRQDDEESVEVDAPLQGYQQGFNPEQEEDFEDFGDEEDEDGYDEDMEDDDEQEAPQEPVVIDLLSSDDENTEELGVADAGSAKAPRPADVESSASSQRDSNASDDEIEAEESVFLRQDSPSEPIAGDSEDEHLQNEGDDDDEDRIENAGFGHDDNAKDQTALDNNTKKLPGKGLEVEENAETIQEVEAVEEVEPMHVEPERNSSDEKHPLQEVDEKRDARDPEETINDPDSSTAQQTSRQLGGNPPTQPSLFARLWNLDGANDERLPSLYPILPQEGDAAPAVQAISVSSSQSRPPIESTSMLTNGQLPTPADTQLSLAREASEVSISSITGHTHHLRSTSDTLLVDSTLNVISQLPKEDDIVAADDTLPHAKAEDHRSLIEGTVTNAETEVTATDAIDEEAANINFKENSREENSGQKADTQKELKVVVEAHNTRSRTRQQNSLEPVADEEVRSVEEAILVSPRRSHRRGKSTSSTAETPQTKRLSTPSKSATRARQDEPRSARTERSSSVILDETATPKGQDASIELAIAALDSPTKRPHDLRSNQPGMDMKLKLTRALRTELSEFTSLKVLKFKLTEKLDVLGIVTSSPPEPERAKAGPRHYRISFNVTDHSISPGGPHVIEVQVFRPYKEALPTVKIGDGILLRDFQVIAVKKGGFALRSTDSSSWAVFREDGEEAVDVRGPPVEFGSGEKKQLALLRSWFRDLDSPAMEKINRANREKGTAGGRESIGKVV